MSFSVKSTYRGVQSAGMQLVLVNSSGGSDGSGSSDVSDINYFYCI